MEEVSAPGPSPRAERSNRSERGQSVERQYLHQRAQLRSRRKRKKAVSQLLRSQKGGQL